MNIEEINQVFDMFEEATDIIEFKELVKDIKQMYNEKEEYKREIEILKDRIHRALHLIHHNDVMDYRVFEQNLKDILRGVDKNA